MIKKARTKEKKIDKVLVKMGRLIKVENTKKSIFSHANDWYYAVQVENANGKGEECLLFTAREIKSAKFRAGKNKEDLTKKGFLIDLLD